MPERAASLETHLREVNILNHKRIPGLTMETCNLLMYECACNRVSLSDIAILCSHVNALYAAVHDNSAIAARSKYFIILEDDVRFQFKVNFQALISVAPKGFGALQLMMSRKEDVDAQFQNYLSKKDTPPPQDALFTYRPRNSTVWSAQAILYDKKKVREFLQVAVVTDRRGKRGFKLVNTFDVKKSPAQSFNYGGYNKYRPSVYSDCIFADMFLYSMSSPTYILNIPFLNSASLGLNSSSHQAHVKHHIHGFGRIQEIQRMFKSKTYPLPSFLSLLEPFRNFNANLSSKENGKNFDRMKPLKTPRSNTTTSSPVNGKNFDKVKPLKAQRSDTSSPVIDWEDLAKNTPLALKDMAAKVRNG
jgi:hypothetical protein